MQFNSIQFILFFIVVIFIYFSISYKYRWFLLLLASYYFYMCWKPEYIFLILLSTVIDYYCGLKMGECDDKIKRKPFLLISITTNLGILFFFKYFNFFSDSTRYLLNQFNIFYDLPYFNLLLPVGISFYTFQTLSYSIDVYKGDKKAEKHFGIFALYVSFFPQLVAGPIERSTRLLPQLNNNYQFDYLRCKNGLMLMLWGFFKKIVIADRLAVLVNTVYSNPMDYQGIPLILATVFFAFQIYCDFSAYSDIAIGASKIMGYDLMKNFNRPYFSKSISEFWRRWHMSLGSWFRDYLYFPLGGNKMGQYSWYQNIMLVFLISGLWHGASWNFIIWGGLHGFYILIGLLLKGIKKYIINFLKLNKQIFPYKLIQVIYTFILVNFAWIFFRANTFNEAIYIIKNIFIINSNVIYDKSLHKLGLDEKDLYLSILLILFLLIIQLIQRKINIINWINSKPVIVRWSLYMIGIYSIIIFGFYAQGDQTQFIYFQF